MRAKSWAGRDGDTYLGPLTFSRRQGPYDKTWGFELNSRACLMVRVAGHALLLTLPDWVCRPRRVRVPNNAFRPGVDDVSATYERYRRTYGWSYHPEDGFLQIFYGRDDDDMYDSDGRQTRQMWSCFVPWRQTRMVRHQYLHADGSLWRDVPEWNFYPSTGLGRTSVDFEEFKRVEGEAPSEVHAFLDHDGELLTATLRREVREWEWGTGWFRWLRHVKKPIVREYVDIAFSGETGNRKGSWKGGTIGTSEDLRGDELPVHAFQRYCEEHRMTYLHEVK